MAKEISVREWLESGAPGSTASQKTINSFLASSGTNSTNQTARQNSSAPTSPSGISVSDWLRAGAPGSTVSQETIGRLTAMLPPAPKSNLGSTMSGNSYSQALGQYTPQTLPGASGQPSGYKASIKAERTNKRTADEYSPVISGLAYGDFTAEEYTDLQAKQRDAAQKNLDALYNKSMDFWTVEDYANHKTYKQQIEQYTKSYNDALSGAAFLDDAQKARVAQLEKEQEAALRQLQRIESEAGWALTVELEQDYRKRRNAQLEKLNSIRAEIDSLDPSKLDFTAQERISGTAKGSSRQWAGSQVAAAGTAVAVGNALQEASSEEDRQIADSLYAGWVTDDLSRQNFLDAGVQGDGVLAENKQVEASLQKRADEMLERSNKELEDAKRNLGRGGQIALDVLAQGIQMGLDAATRAGSVSMWTRSFGSASQEARLQGAGVGQQFIYGAAVATVETLTEKIADGAAGIYGKGSADILADDIIFKLASTTRGQNALRFIYRAVSEGGEEVLSGIMEPVLKAIYDGGEAFKNAHMTAEGKQEYLSELGYSALIGAILGGAGGSVSLATGQDAMSNAQAQARAEITQMISSGNINEAQATYIASNPILSEAFEEVTGITLAVDRTAETNLAGNTIKGKDGKAVPSDQKAILETRVKQIMSAKSQVSQNAQSAQQAQGDAEIPPTTPNASTSQTGELNSQANNAKAQQGSRPSLVEYEREINEHGLSVRKRPRIGGEGVDAPLAVSIDGESSVLTNNNGKANVEKKSVDTIEALTGIPAKNGGKNGRKADAGLGVDAKERRYFDIAKTQLNGREVERIRGPQSKGEGENGPNDSAGVGVIQNEESENARRRHGDSEENTRRYPVRPQSQRGYKKDKKENERDIGKGRLGVSLHGKTGALEGFSPDSYEITFFNDDDAKLLAWAAKYTDAKIRLFVRKKTASNGRLTRAFYVKSTKEIWVDADDPQAIRSVAHEILHHKFASTPPGSWINASTAAHFHLVNPMSEERRNLFRKITEELREYYIELYREDCADYFRKLGYDEDEVKIELFEYDEEGFFLDLANEEVFIEVALSDSEFGDFSLFSQEARTVLKEMGIVSSDFFDSIPYTKRTTKSSNALADTVIERTAPKEKSKPKQSKPIKQDEFTPENIVPPEAEATVNESQGADDDLPFYFGSDEAVAKVHEENTAADMPKKPITAKDTFGTMEGDVAEIAYKISTSPKFTDGDALDKAIGKGKAEKARESFNGFIEKINNFAGAKEDIDSLWQFYSSMKDTPGMSQFYSEYIEKQMEYLSGAYARASADANEYDVRAFRYGSRTLMKMLERRITMVNYAVSNNMNIAIAAQKNAPKKKLDGLFARLATLQFNAITVFEAVDGFNSKAKGIGFAFKEAIEDSVVVESTERVNGNSFFAELGGKNFDNFVRGKTTTGVKLGGVDVREIDAVSIIAMYKSMASMSTRHVNKFDGLNGVMLKNGETETWYEFEKDAETGEIDSREQLRQIARELESNLSPEAKAYSKALTQMFTYYAPKLIDAKVSADGKAPFMLDSKTYFPLRYTFKNKKAQDFSIEDSLNDDYTEYTGKPGMLHQRTDQSGGYLLIEPVTIVANRYINQASKYIGNANISKMLTLMEMPNGFVPTLSETMSENFGGAMGQWMSEYIKDMNPMLDVQQKNWLIELTNPIFKKGRQNLQQGALMLSPSVPWKQGASYWPALGIVRASSLRQAYRPLFHKNVSGNNALARDRRSGNIDPTLDELLSETDTWFGKLRNKSKLLDAAYKSMSTADAKVIENLYAACIVDAQADYKEAGKKADKNSAEFKALVDSKFEQIMLNAQSTSSVTLGSELQRTDIEFLKCLSMFRSQQSQEFNKMVRALGEYSAAKKNGTLTKNDSKKLVANISGQVLSALHFSVATALVNALLHRHKRYEDEEGNVDAGKIIEAISLDFVKNLSGIAWFGDTAAEYLISVLSKGEHSFYGIPLGPIDAFLDASTSLSKLIENPSIANAKYLAGNLGNVFGIPINNVYNVFNTMIMHGLDAAGLNDGRYDDLAKFLDAQIKNSNKGQVDAVEMLAEIGQASSGDVKSDYGITASNLYDLNKQIDKFAKNKENKYDSEGDLDIVGYILDTNGLTTKGKDALIRDNTSKSYYLAYDVLRDIGKTPEQAASIIRSIDGSDGSTPNGNIKKDELLTAHKKNPALDYLYKEIWKAKGVSPSWDEAIK